MTKKIETIESVWHAQDMDTMENIDMTIHLQIAYAHTASFIAMEEWT